VLVAAPFAWDVYRDRLVSVRILAPIALRAEPSLANAPSNPVVSNLSIGTEVRVLRVRYLKELPAFKVRTPSGATGWLLLGPELDVSWPDARRASDH
jgi:hypothetical protein